MGIPGLLCGLAVPVDGASGSPNGSAVQRAHGDAVGCQHGELPVVEDEDLPRLPQERRDVRGDERLVAAEARYERRASAPEHDQGVRSISRDTGDCEGALEVSGRAQDCRNEPVALVVLDEVRDDFGIGLGAKPMPVRRQRLSKLAVVLDDPVVDDGELGTAIDVRMRIGIRRPAVSRPPGVADAQGAVGPVGRDQRLEVGDLAGRLPDVQRPFGDGGDPGRVVSPVLQPTKAGKDEGHRVAMADIADDSTHRRRVPTLLPGGCNRSGRRRCAEGARPTPRGGPSWDSLAPPFPPRRRAARR